MTEGNWAGKAMRTITGAMALGSVAFTEIPVAHAGPVADSPGMIDAKSGEIQRACDLMFQVPKVQKLIGDMDAPEKRGRMFAMTFSSNDNPIPGVLKQAIQSGELQALFPKSIDPVGDAEFRNYRLTVYVRNENDKIYVSCVGNVDAGLIWNREVTVPGPWIPVRSVKK